MISILEYFLINILRMTDLIFKLLDWSLVISIGEPKIESTHFITILLLRISLALTAFNYACRTQCCDKIRT